MYVKARTQNKTTSPREPPSVTGSIQKEIDETRTTIADGIAELELSQKYWKIHPTIPYLSE